MAYTVEQIQIIVDAKVDKALLGLKKSEKATTSFKDNFMKSAKLIAGPLAVGAIIAGTIKMGVEFSKAASDAEEIGSKYATIFRDMGTKAETMADDFADSFGLAGSSARELLGNTADLLTGFGLTQEAAANVSLATNELAADLASFSNAQGGAAAVSAALTSAYSGEREALKTYGIVINEAMIKTQLLKQESEGLTFASEQQAKIAATLTLATKQSSNAIGDVARTFNSHANVTRRLEESTKELKEELGVSVNEGMTPMLVITEKIVSGITDWIKKNDELKESEKAVLDGSATTLQNILVLEKKVAEERAKVDLARRDAAAERNTLELQSMALVKDSGDLSIGLLLDEDGLLDGISEKKELNIRQLERQLTYQMELLAVEKAAQAVIDAKTDKEKEAAAASVIAANIALDRTTQLNNAFAKTKDGQIQALAANIAFFESFVPQGPQAIAILQMLNEDMENLTGTELAHAATIEANMDMLLGREELRKEYHEAELERQQAEINLAKEAVDAKMAVAQALSNSLSSFSDLAVLGNENEIASINASIAAAELKGENTDELEKKKRKLLEENWKTERDFALTQAVINTALAVTKSLSAAPVPFNIALAAIAGAAGAAEIGVIAGQSMPSFATGGEFITSGEQNITVGDNASGAEKVTVEPLGGNSGGSDTMILNIDGEQFVGWLQKQLDNRGLRVSRGSLV